MAFIINGIFNYHTFKNYHNLCFCCSLQPIEPSCFIPPAVTTTELTSSTTVTTMEPPLLAVMDPQPSIAMLPPTVTTTELTSSTTVTTMDPPLLAVMEPQPSTDKQPPTMTTMKPSVIFHDLQMIPCRSRPSNKRSRAKPPSFLLTSDEHLSFLDSKTKNVSKTKKGAASKISVGHNQSGKCREAKQCKKRKAINHKGSKTKRKLSHLAVPAVSEKASTDTDAADNTPCSYCEMPYSQSTVAWYQCRVCEKWACGNCARVGLGRKSKKVFICDDCK